jgi:hypothetical protein
MSTVIHRSDASQWETSDFAWIAPVIVLLLLLLATIAVINGFPRPDVIGPDGFLAIT